MRPGCDCETGRSCIDYQFFIFKVQNLILKRIVNQLVLRPSTDTIRPESATRETIVLGTGELEYYQDQVAGHGSDSASENKLLIVKFPGTGGRAERSSKQPADRWRYDSILWTVNPMGYGGSSGPADLGRYPEMIRAIGDHALQTHPDRKIVVCGNSLGGMSALAMAANFPVAGVLLRNPAPVHQLIGRRTKYLWASLGLSKLLAAQIPKYLDAVGNAARCTSPCWILVSQRDTVVPVSFQRQIIDCYGGLIDVFPLPDAQHDTPVPQELEGDYLRWLGAAGEAIVGKKALRES